MKKYAQGLTSPVLFASVTATGELVDCHFPAPALLNHSGPVHGRQLEACSWWSGSHAEALLSIIASTHATSRSGFIDALTYRAGTDELRQMELWVHRLPGESQTLYCVGTDITDRTAYIESLALSETKFRELSQAVPALVWMHDSQGKHEYANQTFCDFFDVTQEELAGDKWQMLVHPEDASYATRFYEAFEQRVPFNSEVRVTDGQGRQRTLESFATPHFTASGSFNGYVGVTVDITERKYNLQLLTDSIHQKNIFLATLAHELRNPLLPIITGAQLLKQDQSLSTATLEIVDRIARQSSRMTRLVDDILDINRLQKGEFSIHQSVLRMEDILHASVETIADRLQEGRHAININSPDTPDYIWGDEARLIQALSNVLSNAIRYSHPGEHIEVNVTRSDRRCVVEITDHGQGVAAQDQERIFDLYFSTNSSSVRGEINLGIGLWLTRSIVEKHGGTVTLSTNDSTPGTTITLSVPLATKAQLAATETMHEDDKPAADANNKHKRVLIVEDNPDVADTLAKAVERLGSVASIELSATDVVKAIASTQADLVIMDIGLPVVDGITAADKIRRTLGNSAPEMVALTGWSNNDQRERALAAGFNHYLVKPVTLATVKAILTGEVDHQ